MNDINPYQATSTVSGEALHEDLPPEPEARSFGGWLILPFLGLVFTPVTAGFSLVHTFFPMFSNGVWEGLTSPTSPAYHPMWAVMLSYEMLGALGNIALSLVALTYFINKSRTTPKLIIGFLLYNFVMVFGDELFTHLIPYFETHPSKDEAKNLGRAAISVLIWVPYFLKSQRVKATFVRHWPRKAAPAL